MEQGIQPLVSSLHKQSGRCGCCDISVLVPFPVPAPVIRNVRTPGLAWQFLQSEINWDILKILCSFTEPKQTWRKRRIRSGRRCWTVDNSRSKSVLTPYTGSQGPRTENYHAWRYHRYNRNSHWCYFVQRIEFGNKCVCHPFNPKFYSVTK